MNVVCLLPNYPGAPLVVGVEIPIEHRAYADPFSSLQAMWTTWKHDVTDGGQFHLPDNPDSAFELWLMENHGLHKIVVDQVCYLFD